MINVDEAGEEDVDNLQLAWEMLGEWHIHVDSYNIIMF